MSLKWLGDMSCFSDHMKIKVLLKGGRVKLPPRLLLIVALSAFASPSIHLQSSSIELSSLLRLKCLRYLPEPVPDHLLLCFFAFIQTSVVLAGFGLLIKTGPD